MKGNAQSKDFPFTLTYGDIVPDNNRLKRERPVKISPVNCYNNESPSMFRLDSMYENKEGYNNPFLDECIHVDRNEEFKKMDFNRKQISLIDKIKSRREYSQNPKVLRCIRNEFDFAMEEKRERNLKERNKVKEDKSFKISENDVNDKHKELYYKAIDHLHTHYSPRMSYKQKQKLKLDNMDSICNGRYKISDYDKDTYRILTCSLDPKKSGYLANYNNFHISEAEKYTDKQLCKFDQKPRVEYNPTKDAVETVQPPPVVNRKWDSFYENFFMLMNNQRGFLKKGGLFTEFANKNIGVILMNKRNDKEKKMNERQLNLIKHNNSLSHDKRKKREYIVNKSYDNIGLGRVDFDNKQMSNVDKAKKVINDNNLFKLKDVYMKTTSLNNSKEQLQNI